MSARKVEAWVWVLVYGGMVVLGVGLAVQRTHASTHAGTGWAIACAGGALVGLGALLVWVRSRMSGEP